MRPTLICRYLALALWPAVLPALVYVSSISPPTSTLSCYEGVEGLDSTPPTIVNADPTTTMAENFVCVEYCFTCQFNDSSGCVPAQLYTNYAMVSNATVTQMQKLPSAYMNLKVCDTANCNAPSAQGICPVPTPANSSALQCYTGIQKQGDPPGLYRAVGATSATDSCVAYCAVCQTVDAAATGCLVDLYYSFYAIQSTAAVAAMKLNTTQFTGLTTCDTDECNVPSAEGVCPMPMPANASTLRCFTGVQRRGSPPVSYAPVGATTTVDECASFCSTCDAPTASITGCTVGRAYSFYGEYSRNTIANMQAQPAIYARLDTCAVNDCNTPPLSGGVCLPTAQITIMLTLSGCSFATFSTNTTLYSSVLEKTIVHELSNLPKNVLIPAGEIAISDFSVQQASAATRSLLSQPASSLLVVHFTASTGYPGVAYLDWASQMELVSTNGEFVTDLRYYAKRYNAPGLAAVTSVSLVASSPSTNMPSAEPVRTSKDAYAGQLGLSDDAWVGIGIGFLVFLAGSVVVFRAWAASKKALALASLDEQAAGGESSKSSDLIPAASHLPRGSGVGNGGTRSFSQQSSRLDAAGGGQFDRGDVGREL